MDTVPLICSCESAVYILAIAPAAIMWAGVTVALTAVLFLTAGAEQAYFSFDLKKLLPENHRRMRVILKNIDNPKRLLSTILIADCLLQTTVIVSLICILMRFFASTGIVWCVLLFIIMVVYVFMFGEVLPKSFAMRHPAGMATATARLLQVTGLLLRPLSNMLSHTSFIEKRLHNHSQNISLDELTEALNLSADNNPYEDRDILAGIVRFGNKNVSEIMQPRVNVVAVDIKTSFGDLVAAINESGYSRMPVYDGSFDSIKGILFIKDLLPYLPEKEGFEWQTVIRPPFFVPETKKIDVLLEEFQKNQVHIAVVVDEYGGSSGIVTLEDILEEIVGDIMDESDEEEHVSTQLNDNTWLCDGQIQLPDFCKLTGIDAEYFADSRGEADTLAGFILELKGDIPLQDEVINYKDLSFGIAAVDRRRIQKIKVVINTR